MDLDYRKMKWLDIRDLEVNHYVDERVMKILVFGNQVVSGRYSFIPTCVNEILRLGIEEFNNSSVSDIYRYYVANAQRNPPFFS